MAYTTDMKIFAAFRLIMWCLVIALTLAVVILNYVTTQIVNNPPKLQSIARESNTYEIIRDDILSPRILKEAQDAGYGTLVDQKSVQRAVDTAFDDKSLDRLLRPATESMADWLANKQPDASFTVDASKQLATLTDILSAKITANILTQPSCTFANTPGDAAVGRCRVASLSEEGIRSGITDALQSQAFIRSGELSSDQLAVPSSLVRQAQPLPSYLNMLNSVAIFAAGIFVLSSLWLLYKHRFRGMCVLGIGGLLATGIVYAGQIAATTYVQSLTLEAGYQEVARALTHITASELTATLWPVAGVSVFLLVVGMLGVFTMRRLEAKRQHTVHFHSDTRDLDD